MDFKAELTFLSNFLGQLILATLGKGSASTLVLPYFFLPKREIVQFVVLS